MTQDVNDGSKTYTFQDNQGNDDDTPNAASPKEEEEDVSEWLTNGDTERENYIKSKLAETGNGISFLFPSVKPFVSRICFSNCMKYVQENIDIQESSVTEELIVAVAQFKVNSWEEASEKEKTIKENAKKKNNK